MNSPLFVLFDDPAQAIALVICFVLAVALHEMGHAFAATQQGDPTPRVAGRLTPNPFAHVDRLGIIFFVVAGIGWGSTPVTPALFRNGRLGRALVAGIGPVINLTVGILAAIVLRVLYEQGDGNERLVNFVLTFFSINILLGVFNLFPIPPLDGYGVLAAVLPARFAAVTGFLERYGIYLLLALFLLPALNENLNWIGPLVGNVQRLVLRLAGLPI
jgi:Zn-dependent protease